MLDLKTIQKEMEDSVLPTSSILNKAKFLDNSNLSIEFNDKMYLPFYYYLGKHYQSKKVLSFGFGIGLEISAYLTSVQELDLFVALRGKKKTHYSPSLGGRNILSHGKIRECYFLDDINKFNSFISQFGLMDLVVITEVISYKKCMDYLNIAWEKIRDKGLIIIDHISSDNDMNRCYFDFCRGQNQEGITLNTRYGIGVVEK